MFYGGKFKDVFTLNTLRKRLLAKKCVENKLQQQNTARQKSENQ